MVATVSPLPVISLAFYRVPSRPDPLRWYLPYYDNFGGLTIVNVLLLSGFPVVPRTVVTFRLFIPSQGWERVVACHDGGVVLEWTRPEQTDETLPPSSGCGQVKKPPPIPYHGLGGFFLPGVSPEQYDPDPHHRDGEDHPQCSEDDVPRPHDRASAISHERSMAHVSMQSSTMCV